MSAGWSRKKSQWMRNLWKNFWRTEVQQSQYCMQVMEWEKIIRFTFLMQRMMQIQAVLIFQS